MPEAILQPVRPCIKCGAVNRDKRGECIPCYKTTNARYREANREKLKSAKALFYAANRERLRASKVLYQAQNPEKLRDTRAASRRKNREKIRASSTAYRKANPESRRIWAQNRIARKTANGGILSRGLSQKLFALQKGKCACCRQPLGDKFELDHVMPLALGGSNTDENIQLLRAKCNQQKNAKHPIDFMQQRGFLL